MKGRQALLQVGELPPAPLDAAECFYRDYLPRARQILADEVAALAIVMGHAPRDHDDWRRALSRDLARAHAPQRINVVAGDEGEERVVATLQYLEGALGVTGQYIPTHD